MDDLDRFKWYVCPVCYFYGSFEDSSDIVRVGRYASRCPNCRSNERTRLMKLLLNNIAGELKLWKMSCGHFSPIECQNFRMYFNKYEHINVNGIEHDIRGTGFEKDKFDVTIGIHILEHVHEDDMALSEISRITKHLALWSVPTDYDEMKELDEPDSDGHVRQTTAEYYERFRKHFKKVDVVDSTMFPSIYQTQILGKNGKTYKETIPVCYV